MRDVQNLNARHRIRMGTPVFAGRASGQDAAAHEKWVIAAKDALDDMGNVISNQCFSDPDALTQDDITVYALALLRLRECASAAGFERLTNACDALAVTVSRLIEDRSCACGNKCKALTLFVAHAQSMIQSAVDSMTGYAMPTPDSHIAVNRVNTRRNGRALM
ncbi:MAG: hypothetical protein ACYCY9_12965 [Thiobacillus sp.]